MNKNTSYIANLAVHHSFWPTVAMQASSSLLKLHPTSAYGEVSMTLPRSDHQSGGGYFLQCSEMHRSHVQRMPTVWLSEEYVSVWMTKTCTL